MRGKFRSTSTIRTLFLSRRFKVQKLSGTIDPLVFVTQSISLWSGPISLWSKLPFELPFEIKADVQAVPVPIVARSKDKLAWKYSTKGEFELKSAYLLASNLMEAESFPGSWILKLQTLPRIQMFFWKCMHSSIGVKNWLASRGIPIDADCLLCYDQAESISHALQDCQVVKHVWLQLGIQDSDPLFFSQNIRT